GALTQPSGAGFINGSYGQRLRSVHPTWAPRVGRLSSAESRRAHAVGGAPVSPSAHHRVFVTERVSPSVQRFACSERRSSASSSASARVSSSSSSASSGADSPALIDSTRVGGATGSGGNKPILRLSASRSSSAPAVALSSLNFMASVSPLYSS